MQLKLNKTFISILYISILMTNSSIIFAQSKLSYQLHKGVITDTSNQKLYVINPKNGIDSISSITGETLWHSDSADLPIQVIDSKIYAISEDKTSQIPILVTIDQSNGQMLQKKALNFPKNISTNISEGINGKFTISATNIESNDLKWSYQAHYSQGSDIQEFGKPSVTFGDILLSPDNSLGNIQFKVNNKDKSLKSAMIKTGLYLPKINGRQFKDITGDYILVSQLKPNAGIWDKYLWKIYNLKGDLQGEITHHNSFRPFSIQNNSILFVDVPNIKMVNDQQVENPLSVVAYSLITGQKLWEKQVRDLSFQGVYPQ